MIMMLTQHMFISLKCFAALSFMIYNSLLSFQWQDLLIRDNVVSIEE